MNLSCVFYTLDYSLAGYVEIPSFVSRHISDHRARTLDKFQGLYGHEIKKGENIPEKIQNYGPVKIDRIPYQNFLYLTLIMHDLLMLRRMTEDGQDHSCRLFISLS